VCQLPLVLFLATGAARFVEDAGHGFRSRSLQIKPYGKPRPALIACRRDYVMSRSATVKATMAAVPTCAARDELTVRALRTATGARTAAVPASPIFPSHRFPAVVTPRQSGGREGFARPARVRHRTRRTVLQARPCRTRPASRKRKPRRRRGTTLGRISRIPTHATG